VRLCGEDGEDGGDRGGATAETAAMLRARPAPVVLSFTFEASTTALALFSGAEMLRAETVLHSPRDAASTGKLEAPREQRVRAVRAFLEAACILPGALGAVAVRADTVRPVEVGTYAIDAALLREAGRQRPGGSASLAAAVAHEIASAWGCPAFAVDPASSDECAADGQRASGACERDLLVLKAAARRHARAVDRPLDSLRLVLVYLGRWASLCVEKGARVGDVQRAFDPATAGFDFAAALERAEAGDGHASAVLHAAANDIAKAIGGLATVLEGEVDAVLVTGSLERAGLVVAEICRRVEWIAPVFLYRSEDELLVLAHGAHAVLQGEEPLKHHG
jgi:butyrate kinase